MARQFDVELLNDSQTGEEIFVNDEEMLMWYGQDVSFYDWKQEAEIDREIERLESEVGGEIVILFDGSDVVYLASLASARSV